MNQSIQPQEQIQPLMVQVQWLATAISVIMGIVMIVDTVSTVIKSISEVREAEKK